jgi:hypothetical protein
MLYTTLLLHTRIHRRSSSCSIGGSYSVWLEGRYAYYVHSNCAKGQHMAHLLHDHSNSSSSIEAVALAVTEVVGMQ